MLSQSIFYMFNLIIISLDIVVNINIFEEVIKSLRERIIVQRICKNPTGIPQRRISHSMVIPNNPEK